MDREVAVSFSTLSPASFTLFTHQNEFHETVHFPLAFVRVVQKFSSRNKALRLPVHRGVGVDFSSGANQIQLNPRNKLMYISPFTPHAFLTIDPPKPSS